MTDFPTLEDASYEISTEDYDSDSQRRQHATSDAWRKSSRLDKARQMRKALVHQRRLENASKQLSTLSASSQQDPELSRLAEEISAATAGLSKFLSDIASTRFFNERRPAVPTAARRVFDIPELLERILEPVHASDLLQVQLVDKTMYHAIEGSASLQKRLNLRSSPSGFLHTPFTPMPRSPSLKAPRPYVYPPLHFPGFVCFEGSNWNPLFNVDPEDDRAKGKVHLTARFTEATLPKIGKKCRKMLICEPPIYEMEVYPLCCSVNHHDTGLYTSTRSFGYLRHRPFAQGPWGPHVPAVQAADALRQSIETISSSKGLTIGDLYDATVKTRAAHRMCPFASTHLHNEEGEVTMIVSFGGAVDLDPKDPRYPPLSPRQSLNQQLGFIGLPSPPGYGPEEAREQERLERYVEAKQNALVDGRPIPTFKEFREIDDARPLS